MFLYTKNIINKKSNNLLEFLKETLWNWTDISEFKDIITVKRVNKRDVKISKMKDWWYNVSNWYMDYWLFKDYNAIASKILTEHFTSLISLKYDGENKKDYFAKDIVFIDYWFTYVKIPEDDLFWVDFKTKEKYLSEWLSKKDIVDLYNKELNFREDNIKLSDLFVNSDIYSSLFFEEWSLKDIRLPFWKVLTTNNNFFDLFPEVKINNIFKYLLFKRKKLDKRDVYKFEKSFSKVWNYKFVNYPELLPEKVSLMDFIWGNLKISIFREWNSFSVKFFHKDFPDRIIRNETDFKFLVIALNYIKDFFINNFTTRNIPKWLTLKDLKLDKKSKIETWLSMLVWDNRILFTNLLIPFDFINKNWESIKTWKDISENGNDIVIPEYYTLESLIWGKLSSFLPISIHIERFTYLFVNAERLYPIRGIISYNKTYDRPVPVVNLWKKWEEKQISIYFWNNKNETEYVLFNINDISNKEELFRNKDLNKILEFLSKTKKIDESSSENFIQNDTEINNTSKKTVMDYLKWKVVGKVEEWLEEKIKELGLDYDFFEALTKPMIIKLQNSNWVYFPWIWNNKVKLDDRLLNIKLSKLKEYWYFDISNNNEKNVTNLSKYTVLSDNEKNLILKSNDNIKIILKNRWYLVDWYLQRVCQKNNNIFLNTLFENFKWKVKVPNRNINIEKIRDNLFWSPEDFTLFEKRFKFEYNVKDIEKLLKKYHIDYEISEELTYDDIRENILLSVLLNAGENFTELSNGSIYFRWLKEKYFGSNFEKFSEFIINIIKEIWILRRNIETYYISESDENKGAFIDKIEWSNINPKDFIITKLFQKVEIDSWTSIVRKWEKLITVKDNGEEIEWADYELIKWKWWEQIWEFLMSLNNKFTLSDKTLRIRWIARYKALWLYWPSSKTLLIDVWKGYKSFIHEFWHLIDFELWWLEWISSKNQDFLNNIYSRQTLLMKDFIYNKLDKKSDEYLSLVWKNKFNLDYYLTYTEVFARMFEIYIALKYWEKYNEIWRVLWDDKINSFDYTRDGELEKEIIKFYDSLLY